jgi:hypothetical protein
MQMQSAAAASREPRRWRSRRRRACDVRSGFPTHRAQPGTALGKRDRHAVHRADAVIDRGERVVDILLELAGELKSIIKKGRPWPARTGDCSGRGGVDRSWMESKAVIRSSLGSLGSRLTSSTTMRLLSSPIASASAVAAAIASAARSRSICKRTGHPMGRIASASSDSTSSLRHHLLTKKAA